mmetsp:Transcript_9548/g.25964  ORF Transcript_9548/g.25964 Transcript_9548/m.25964 type:complete len:344 (-) Transcript_9548:570-1601(-)
MSFVPTPMQSMPRKGFSSLSCLALTAATDSMGDSPAFSASESGTTSRASANALRPHCSMPGTVSATPWIANEQAISAAPPPYTIRLSLTRFLATHRASCRDRLVSSTIILLPPRTKMLTALVFLHPSTTSCVSCVVPNPTSRTVLAKPSLSGVSSSNLGTIRAPVASARSSISTPPTHRTAGRSLCISKWLASSSKPHWQTINPAPESLHRFTMSRKYCCSCSRSASNFSTLSMSILCLIFGLGGSNGHVKIAILTSVSTLGICGWLNSLSRRIPCTSDESSRRPPLFPSSLMRSRFTSFRFRSATSSTASTHISANCRLHRPTIFDDNVVIHVFTSASGRPA